MRNPHDKRWHVRQSSEFIDDAETIMQKQRNSINAAAARSRKIIGELYAIEARDARARPSRAVDLRQAEDIQANGWQAFRWAQLISEPLERLYAEAMIRLRDWDRRRAV